MEEERRRYEFLFPEATRAPSSCTYEWKLRGIRADRLSDFLFSRHIFARRTVHYTVEEEEECGGGAVFLLSTPRLEIPNLPAIVGTIGSFDPAEYCVT